jgi:uncharacterized membrane protein YoaK (UPF0700 family)
MWDSSDDISTPRRQAAVMGSKFHREDMSREASIGVDILSASTSAGSRDRQSMRDLLLVALTVASGAVDAISYFGLGKIFSAFMTGNIVFLGFGVAEIEGPDVVPVIVALSMFTVGAYVGLRFTTPRSNESGLWPPAVTVLLFLVAVAEASFLVVWLSTAGHPSTEVADVLIALFSLAMGIQTAAVRSLGVQGVFTTAGTFTLVAFAGTFAGSRSRSEMHRLAGVLLGLVAGAVAGGLLFLHARSYAPALPLVITVLVLLAGRAMQRSRESLTASQYPSLIDRSATSLGHDGVIQGTSEVKAHSANRTRRTTRS